MKGLGFVTSLIIAVFGGSLKIFNYQAKWFSYRQLYRSSISEFWSFDNNVGEYAKSDDKNALFVERADNMIQAANLQWTKSHTPASGSS
jgi:hypothetical protein